MDLPHEHSRHGTPDAVGESVGYEMPNRQQTARSDESMRNRDMGHDNAIESETDELRTVADVGAVVPIEGETPDDESETFRIPNAESAVVTTAHSGTTGVNDTEFEIDDEVTAEAEDRNEPVKSGAAFEGLDRQESTTSRAGNTQQREPWGTKFSRVEEGHDVRNVDPELPIEGYRHLTVPEILERVFAMPIEQARAVQRYEGTHRRRKTLLVKLERYLRGK
jgi:hypothetical protein